MRYVRTSLANYENYREKRRQKHRAIFAVCFLKLRWRMRMKKFRNSLHFVYLNRMRYCFMMKANMINNAIQMRNQYHADHIKEKKRQDEARDKERVQRLERGITAPLPPTLDAGIKREPYDFRSIIEKRALHQILKPFITETVMIQKYISKARYIHNHFTKIQKRVKAILQTRDGKYDALVILWDQQIEAMKKITSKKKNQDLTEFLKKLTSIKPEIK